MGCSPEGREESDTTEQLPFHFSLSCVGEGNGSLLAEMCVRLRGVTSASREVPRVSTQRGPGENGVPMESLGVPLTASPLGTLWGPAETSAGVPTPRTSWTPRWGGAGEMLERRSQSSGAGDQDFNPLPGLLRELGLVPGRPPCAPTLHLPVRPARAPRGRQRGCWAGKASGPPCVGRTRS